MRYCLVKTTPVWDRDRDYIKGSRTTTLRCYTKKRLAQKHLRRLQREAGDEDYGPEFRLVQPGAMRWKGKERKYPRGRQKTGLPRAAEIMRAPDDLPF